ncbi:MAG TPA: phosphotransferase family protein [Candidatus Limnocylindrales bacterium]|nr:phosphotransferase family protein [Candidatus Limnocylindrales bacterium]
MSGTAADIAGQGFVRGFVAERYGPRARAVDFVVLPGNSGQTVRFAVHDQRGQEIDVLVARCAPAGMPPVGHLDLERQAGFLHAAAEATIPVPEVVFAANSSATFPSATMITRWVRGTSMPDWAGRAGDRTAMFQQAAEVLARIHSLPVERTPARSDQPRSPEAEIEHWSAVARPSRVEWLARLDRLAEKLVAAPPMDSEPAVTHGDFRLGNLVVRGTRIGAVVDWELARSGSSRLDLAWLLMYLDAPWWYHGVDGGVAEAVRRAVQDRYLTTCVSSAECAPWFQAAVRFKQAAIIAYNYRLHITGKRPDLHWEHMLQAVPALLGRAERLLS